MKIILYESEGLGLRPDLYNPKLTFEIGEKGTIIFETELNYHDRDAIDELVISLFKEACIFKNIDYFNNDQKLNLDIFKNMFIRISTYTERIDFCLEFISLQLAQEQLCSKLMQIIK